MARRSQANRDSANAADTNRIVDADSGRVQLLLDRIESNYSKLDEQLGELEELVPIALEKLQQSAAPNKPR